MSEPFNEDIKALSEKWSGLSARHAALLSGKAAVEAELSARKRSLRRLMDECNAAGFDPNTLKESIAKMLEVIRAKLEVLDSDITAGERILKPMLDSINSGG